MSVCVLFNDIIAFVCIPSGCYFAFRAFCRQSTLQAQTTENKCAVILFVWALFFLYTEKSTFFVNLLISFVYYIQNNELKQNVAFSIHYLPSA